MALQLTKMEMFLSMIAVWMGCVLVFGGWKMFLPNISLLGPHEPVFKEDPKVEIIKNAAVTIVPAKLDEYLSPLLAYKFYTDAEIEYKEGNTPYLVIIGHVFDITKGFKSYEPGSSYHGFIGRDASRAFVSGQFDENGLTNDLTDLSTNDFAGLADWLKFYIKTYTFVGYHYGRFFDTDKMATIHFRKFQEMCELSKLESKMKLSVQKEFPPCNVEWSQDKGTNVWCSMKSGGIERDWVGFPVLFKESPVKDTRCACVQESQFSDPRINYYEGCTGTHRCSRVSD